MPHIQATAVVQTLTSLFPTEALWRSAKATGVVKRVRKVNVAAFFWTLVLGFGVGKLRSLADLRRAYENRSGVSVEESSFQDRFTPALASWLRGLALEVLASLATGPQRLASTLAGFRDLLLIDSTVLRLRDLLKGSFAACRTNHTKAAAKLHVVMSVGNCSPTRLKLTPERTNDRTPWRRVGGWVKDCLLLFDLGYFGYHHFVLIHENGGFFISRLKGNANPRIVAQNRLWRGRSKPVVGLNLRDAVVGLQREILDVDVEVGFDRRVYDGKRRRDRHVFRVVGVFDEQTRAYHLFMTNVPADRLEGSDIAETYRLRWQIELLFKELKQHYRLDQIPSGKKAVVEALIFAAVLTLVASHALLDAARRRMPAGRTIPPLRWAAVFDAIAPGLLTMVIDSIARRRGATDPWLVLLAQAVDPNIARPYALAERVSYAH
jgi:IS4 transposase